MLTSVIVDFKHSTSTNNMSIKKINTDFFTYNQTVLHNDEKMAGVQRTFHRVITNRERGEFD